MTDPKPDTDPTPDPEGVFSRFKELINEVLDEREVKAKEAAEEAAKNNKEPEPKRTDSKPTIFQNLFGG